MATVLEIVQGISQVLANTYDGAMDEGERKQTGLKRDMEYDIKDKRVLDGFTVKMHSGNKLCVMYTTEVLAKEVIESKGKYEDSLLETVADIVAYIKKEYRKVTGNSLSLKEIKDTPPEFSMMQTSLVRTEVKVRVDYEVDGLGSQEEEDKFRAGNQEKYKKWLELASDKKPDNDSRKPEKSDK